MAKAAHRAPAAGARVLGLALGTRLTLRGDGADVEAAFVALAAVFLAGLAREVA